MSPIIQITALICTLILTGCGSMIAHSEGPRPDLYSGVRADAHYILDSKRATNALSSAIDVPFSFVCDTLFLPVFDIPAAIVKAGQGVAGQNQRSMDDEK